MQKGIVYLVGAGPGDPGLITLKGIRCLQEAQVIIYDRLINPVLLNYASPETELVFLGKIPGSNRSRQEEINRLLVNRAKEGKVVVRLKGGDPFVFGRGGEEAEVLAAHNLPFEIVPGITSAIAVPAYAGIPLTHRGYTSSLGIVTGNQDVDKGEDGINWGEIASAVGTLVILMGMANLKEITTGLVRAGREPETPAALIYCGTFSEQQTYVGTLADIAQKAAAAGLTNPAVLVVGDVVALREKLKWREKKPLFGKRVLVTRAREQAGSLSRAIAALGGEPFEFPVIKVTPPDDFSPFDQAIAFIESYDWIIFTSVNGVKFFFRRLAEQKKDIRRLKDIHLGAIGPRTKEALENYGLMVDFVPESYRAEEISAGLKYRLFPGARVLLPRAKGARDVLVTALTDLGTYVDEVTAYQTIGDKGNIELVRFMLAKGHIHVITFTSSSTVRNFISMLNLNASDLADLLAKVTVACIGPVTAQTAIEAGLKVDIIAREYTVEGLVKALVDRQEACLVTEEGAAAARSGD